MSTMTTVTVNAINSGFIKATPVVTRRTSRSRRANIRLARALVVLSLTVVFGAGFAMQAGAGSKDVPTKPNSYVTVTVAPGESVWSIAKALNSNGDVRDFRCKKHQAPLGTKPSVLRSSQTS